MEFLQLHYFVNVCDAGSFTRAAAALNLTQPTISRQIALLEEDLGQRLLERTGRGVIPTEAGRALLPRARAMLSLARETRDELHEFEFSPTGKVSIGLPPRIARGITVPLVHQFRGLFPRASLSIQEGFSVNIREMLIGGRLDLALLFDPQPSPALAFETVRRERLFLVAPAQVVISKPVGLDTLTRYSMILPAAPNALRVLIDSTLAEHGIHVDVIAEVGATQTIIPLVARNMGCTILPEGAIAAYGEQPDVQIALIDSPIIHSSLVLAVPLARPSATIISATLHILKTLQSTNLLLTTP
jgi:LysR family nitrogen assimilation transcriptional regulator